MSEKITLKTDKTPSEDIKTLRKEISREVFLDMMLSSVASLTDEQREEIGKLPEEEQEAYYKSLPREKNDFTNKDILTFMYKDLALSAKSSNAPGTKMKIYELFAREFLDPNFKFTMKESDFREELEQEELADTTWMLSKKKVN